jgi:hypothetical protein
MNSFTKHTGSVYFFKNLNLEVTLALCMFKNPQPKAITKRTTQTHSSKPMLGDSLVQRLSKK